MRPECTQCEPQTFGCHPVVGCEVCNCSRPGIVTPDVSCDTLSGQCRYDETRRDETGQMRRDRWDCTSCLCWFSLKANCRWFRSPADSFLFPLGLVGVYCLFYPAEAFVCWAFPLDFHVLCSYLPQDAAWWFTSVTWILAQKETHQNNNFSLLIYLQFNAINHPRLSTHTHTATTLWRKNNISVSASSSLRCQAPVLEIPKKAVIPLPVFVSWHDLGCGSHWVDCLVWYPGCTCQLLSVLCGSWRFINVVLLNAAKTVFICYSHCSI